MFYEYFWRDGITIQIIMEMVHPQCQHIMEVNNYMPLQNNYWLLVNSTLNTMATPNLVIWLVEVEMEEEEEIGGMNFTTILKSV